MALLVHTWTPEAIAAEPGATEVFGTLLIGANVDPDEVTAVELHAVPSEGAQEWSFVLRAHLPPDPTATVQGYPVARYVDIPDGVL